MAVVQRTRISSLGAGMLVAGVAVAIGSYPVSAMTSPVLVPAAALQAQVPDWVLSYEAPAQVGGFKVDEFIENLSYEQPASAALPGWVERYLAPSQTPAFKVDTMIDGLDYRQTGGGAGAPSDITGFQP